MTTCGNCGKPITGVKWCSDKCRMAYKRTLQPEHQPEQKAPEQALPEHCVACRPLSYCGVHKELSPWFNSSTKTQVEIETHYTLANYPAPVYQTIGSTAKGGSLSPYPMTDGRYKAYINR